MSVPLTIRQEPVVPQSFLSRVQQSHGGPLKALSIRSVQLNLGLRCNLSCGHCHVKASPRRREQMTWKTMNLALGAARRVRAAVVDLTGGEPLLHPRFIDLVEAIRAGGMQVIVRTNLVSLERKGQEATAEFLKKHRVRIIATLPSLEATVTDSQRGVGIYQESIGVVKKLNAIGYGIDPTLPLDLVHHPPGALLLPRQSALEHDYKRELGLRHGIRFTQLFAVANMPVGRFAEQLAASGEAAAYLHKLRTAFNPHTLAGLMCRHLLHVAWDGTLYDCDFNCGLGLKLRSDTPTHIRDFDASTFLQRRINSGEHCYGCTAGRGSSFTGALV